MPAAGEVAPGRELSAAEAEAMEARPAAAAEPAEEELGVSAAAAVPETGAPKVRWQLSRLILSHLALSAVVHAKGLD